jgi:type I restriction enzyme S subunit
LSVQFDGTYREIGIRSHGKGVFHKASVSGAELGDKRVFYVEPGDFVLNIVFAWEGAIALISESERGMIASHRFPTFRSDPARLDLRFLRLYFSTPRGIELLGRVSPGGAGRNRTLNRTAFLSLEIPLPPLPEQRRLVARIDEVAAAIGNAKALQEQIITEADALCRAILCEDAQAPAMPLRELVSLRTPDVAVRADETYHFAGVYCFGRGVFVGECKTGLAFSYSKLTRLRAGNFVYPKLMAWEGAFGIVPPECDGLVVSTEFPVFELSSEVLPEVLDTYFRDPARWQQIAGSSTGTNVRRRRLNPRDFLDHRMPLPSMETQLRLREVRREVNALNAAQAVRHAELDALLPAILDRVFAGAL